MSELLKKLFSKKPAKPRYKALAILPEVIVVGVPVDDHTPKLPKSPVNNTPTAILRRLWGSDPVNTGCTSEKSSKKESPV